TAYQAVRSRTETPKRYRYTGKERDEENGFTYHGARYYAAWVGRWVSCDPKGVATSIALYTYGRCNPIAFVDPTGGGDRTVGTIAPVTIEGRTDRQVQADLKKALNVDPTALILALGKGPITMLKLEDLLIERSVLAENYDVAQKKPEPQKFRPEPHP